MTRALRLTILAAVAALAAAACGGGGGDGAAGDDAGVVVGEDAEGATSAFELVAASPDRLETAGSARIDATFSMTGLPELGGSFDFAMEGSFDFTTGDGSMTMDLGALGALTGLSVGEIEMRVVDQVVYMSFGAFADLFAQLGAPLPSDAQWLRLDPVAFAEEFGVPPDQLGLGTGSTDLTQSFELLREVSRSVTEIGVEEVRGAPTTHYRADVDIAAALGQLPDELQGLPGLDLAGLGLDTVPVDVWIGVDDELLRRMEISMDFGAMDIPDAGDAAMVMAFDLYDFGVAIDVVAPPADQVVDMMSLFGGMLGGADSADLAA